MALSTAKPANAVAPAARAILWLRLLGCTMYRCPARYALHAPQTVVPSTRHVMQSWCPPASAACSDGAPGLTLSSPALLLGCLRAE